MNLDTFPTLKRLLSTQGPTQWDKPWKPEQLQRLERALETWSDGLSDGSIENARFLDSKDVIARALETAWKVAPRDKNAVDLLPDPHRNALDTLPAPNLANLEGRLKRVNKAPDSGTRETLQGLLTELTPLANAYAFLKANARKRQFKTEEEREGERFTPPTSSSQAVAQVRAILEQAIDRAYQGLVDHYQQANRRMIQTYLEAQTAALSDPERAGKNYSPTTHFTHTDRHGRRGVTNPHGVAFLSEVLGYDYENTAFARQAIVYKQTPETLTKSDQKAEKNAQDVRNQFLFKNLAKLTPVLEAKGDALFDQIREVGRFNLFNMEGEFALSFKDGASFHLRNAVVFVVNQLGTPFHRFPTTFHDVRLPGGEPMPSPSEERMHTVFAPGAVATPPETPDEGIPAPQKRPRPL